MANLITLDDFGAYVKVSQLIPTQRSEPTIAEAQHFDLRPILNDALYYDMLQNYQIAGAGSISATATAVVGVGQDFTAIPLVAGDYLADLRAQTFIADIE